ncbi:DUF2511 domain-containing protein [Dickeya fangzhongdai]|uniref:DUF2511 domain-containing protein n=1 Tax=Dickeya fangzhongdai TaxID=1778540 RepID=UPI001ADB8263|nr:DUF2511 domain-containing protein [Dickeya fangzhongdai]MBO8132335.1 DUF2511 domain-containing protein [Dickeya fangzhongdai]
MKLKSLLVLSVFAFSTSAFAVPLQAVDKESFKGTWPFSFSEGQLQCLKGGAYIMNFKDNKVYALTGLARNLGKSWGALPLESKTPVWLNDPKNKGAKMSLSDITDAALALCDK